jgi:archaellum biogenesis ATPase FlaH
MLLEYKEYFRKKKAIEEMEQKEQEDLDRLEELREEMINISHDPLNFKNNDILKYIEDWTNKIKPIAPIPKINNFMECEPIALETILKVGYIQIPKGITCCVHAPGGAGKSVLMQRVIMASGLHACYISGEDSAGIMASMLQPYKTFYSANNADFVHFDNQNIDGVLDFLRTSEYELYVIDPLSSFCTGDKWGRVETENGVASELLRIFNGITAKTGKTIIYTHHEAKSSNDIRTAARGSSALVDNARMGISLNRISERYRPAHKTNKNRYEEQEDHMRNVKTFQRSLFRYLQQHNRREFANQEIVGVIEMTCHKNNYGNVGDKAEFILTSAVGKQGLNVVPAGMFGMDIRSAIGESFIKRN